MKEKHTKETKYSKGIECYKCGNKVNKISFITIINKDNECVLIPACMKCSKISFDKTKEKYTIEE